MQIQSREAGIYYEEYGAGKPILCIHGFGEDLRMMKGCIEPMNSKLKNYRRIYIDLPGMGKSVGLNEIKNADLMIKKLMEFINKVIGNELFFIVGQSYGGYLTLGLLYYMSNQIDGIFLLCPCIVPDYSQRILPEKNIIFRDKIFDNKIDHDEQDFLDYAVTATKGVYDRYRNEILPGLMLGDKHFLEEFQRNGYSLSYTEELNKLIYSKPTCILTGKQDHCVGYKDAFNILKCFPRSTFSIIDMSGHNLQIENKNLFEAHFIDWINRMEFQEKL